MPLVHICWLYCGIGHQGSTPLLPTLPPSPRPQARRWALSGTLLASLASAGGCLTLVTASTAAKRTLRQQAQLMAPEARHPEQGGGKGGQTSPARKERRLSALGALSFLLELLGVKRGSIHRNGNAAAATTAVFCALLLLAVARRQRRQRRRL